MRYVSVVRKVELEKSETIFRTIHRIIVLLYATNLILVELMREDHEFCNCTCIAVHYFVV